MVELAMGRHRLSGRDSGQFLLLYPPLVKSGLNGPPLGIQHLAWSLRSAGVEGEMLDLNISYAKELVADRNIERELRNPTLGESDVIKLSSLSQIPERDRLRFPRAFEVVHPTSDGLAGDLASRQEEQIRRFRESETLLLFLDVLERLAPKLVGLSILSFSQAPFAFELAELVKREAGSIVVLGGSEITGWPETRLAGVAKCEAIDFVVLKDGEEAICDIWFGRAATEGKIIRGKPTPLGRIPIDASFQIDPSAYLKPQMYNVVESKGCYWNRCSHCDYISLNDKLDFGRDIGDLVATVNRVVAHTGVTRLHLVNETLTPMRAKRLAEEIIRTNSVARWNSFVKIDKLFSREILSILPRGGCDFLVIGLESLSDRVLRILKKGYTADEAVEWLRMAVECNVDLVLNFMICVPGSTRADEEETLDRLAEFPQLAARSKVFTFVLSRLAEMGRSPESFGIRLLPQPTVSQAHRGGSSLAFAKPSDSAARLEAFNQGLQKLKARHRIAGSITQFLLSLKAAVEPPDLVLALSPSVTIGRLGAAVPDRCMVYDYRNGIRLLLPKSAYSMARKLVDERRFRAIDFVALGTAGWDARAEMIRCFGEAGFLRTVS